MSEEALCVFTCLFKGTPEQFMTAAVDCANELGDRLSDGIWGCDAFVQWDPPDAIRLWGVHLPSRQRFEIAYCRAVPGMDGNSTLWVFTRQDAWPELAPSWQALYGALAERGWITAPEGGAKPEPEPTDAAPAAGKCAFAETEAGQTAELQTSLARSSSPQVFLVNYPPEMELENGLGQLVHEAVFDGSATDCMALIKQANKRTLNSLLVVLPDKSRTALHFCLPTFNGGPIEKCYGTIEVVPFLATERRCACTVTVNGAASTAANGWSSVGK